MRIEIPCLYYIFEDYEIKTFYKKIGFCNGSKMIIFIVIIMGRVLCIDYGLKRTGIAVSDPLKIISSPLTTILSTEIIKFLEAYLKKHEVESLVIGYPLALDGKPTPMTKETEIFISKLNRYFPEYEIYKIDERFTSVIASKAIIYSGVKKQKRKDKSTIDKISASLILQSFLERNKKKG